MSKAAPKQRPARRPVQHPTRRRTPRRLKSWLLVVAVASAAAIATAIAVVVAGRGDGTESGGAAARLPNTPDYHSLLVAPTDPRTLVLGTHDGLFRSVDGGLSWQRASLSGQDAMNLARAEGAVVWTAGHNVLARSADGGRTWEDVRPPGLPHLDIHGFAVDPRDRNVLWAALAGQGLYRSNNGGDSFALVTREVGAGVMALAVTPEGRLLAGDMQQGLMTSTDEGKSWKLAIRAGLMGLAVNPDEPERILATGPGILLSTDGGVTWEQIRAIDPGAGPVAWSTSNPQLAYVVGFDRTLYRTSDGGRSWEAVTGGDS